MQKIVIMPMLVQADKQPKMVYVMGDTSCEPREGELTCPSPHP
jgi:hypothetical protein